MIYEHAHLTVDSAACAEFESAFLDARQYLLDSNGGKTVELIRSVDQSGVYLLRVGWDSVAEHIEDFPESRNARLLADKIARFFTAAPYVVHFEASTI